MAVKRVYRFTFPNRDYRGSREDNLRQYYREGYDLLSDAIRDAELIVRDVGESSWQDRMMVPTAECWVVLRDGDLHCIARTTWEEVEVKVKGSDETARGLAAVTRFIKKNEYGTREEMDNIATALEWWAEEQGYLDASHQGSTGY